MNSINKLAIKFSNLLKNSFPSYEELPEHYETDISYDEVAARYPEALSALTKKLLADATFTLDPSREPPKLIVTLPEHGRAQWSVTHNKWRS